MTLIPTQYLLLAKIGVLSVFLIGAYATGHHNGEKSVQADWDRSKAQFIDAQSKLIAKHAEEIEALRKHQDQTNIQVSQDHQKAIDELQKTHDADLAAVRATGGLRIPRAACTSSITAGTETASPGRLDADVTGTIALPEEITRNLFDLAAEADRTTEIARSCQGWIRKNDFYKH